MDAAPARDRGWTVPAQAVDAALALFLAFIGVGSVVGELHTQSRSQLLPVAVPLALVASLPVAWRRTAHTVAVLVLCDGAFALREVLAPHVAQPSGLGVAFTLYTYALTRDRERSRRALGIVLVVNAAAGTLGLLFGGGSDVVGNVIGPGFLACGAWAAGDNVRTRRAYLASLEERAARLEREREQEAVRAVLDERARIARELHDAVAHHVSAIAVTAGAAEEIAEHDPRRAREALRAIQATSRSALGEMRAIVGVLSPGSDAEFAPQPGLGELERLMDQAGAAGLAVTLRVEGAPRQLPEALDLSAYRIVQEGLTNALKHAGGARALVLVRWEPDAVELVVSDDGSGSPAAAVEPAHPGRGLIGLRERVALFHGELTAGPADGGGYVVRARLPLEPPAG